MIERFIHIKNVGRFRDATPGRNGDCGEITLIDAPNGSGKTTLAAILHSLDQGEPGFITERDTVYTSGSPDVKIMYDGCCYEFDGEEWSPDISSFSIEIFDTHFVNTNIYAGDYFEHGHIKNLYQFIIGQSAGRLDNRIREIRNKTSDISGSIRDKKEEIRNISERDIDVDDFMELEEIDNVEEKIKIQEKKVGQIKRADMLRNRDNLDPTPIKSVPNEKVENLLKKTLDDVSEDAEEKLRRHLNEHTDGSSEKWINKGVEFIKDKNCPFCGSNVEDNNLVSSYRDYFSDAYEKHKSKIDGMIGEVDSWLPPGGWRKMESTIEKNMSVLESWNEDIDFPKELELSLQVDSKRVWEAMRSSLKELLERKQSSPLVELSLSEDYEESTRKIEEMNEKLKEYNQNINKINKIISNFKSGLDEGNLEEEEEKLRRLKNCKIRHSEEGDKICSRLRDLEKKKSNLRKEKNEKRKKLDKVESELMDKYHTKINSFLDKAAADFEIVELQKSMAGGSPSAKYAINISGETISLGSARTDIGKKGFRNILSEGDRNTLAFAFFYAKVLTDPNINDKVVVIDDPVSSLDSTRRNTTLNAIREIYNLSSQTIVLSHDTKFLTLLIDKLNLKSDDINSKFISVSKKYNPIRSEISRVEPESLKSKIEKRHIKHLNKLKSFYYEEENLDYEVVSTSLRIVLEAALSRRFPERNLSMASTTAWQSAIEDANPDSPLHTLKDTPYLDTLKELNSFIHDSHHAGGPSEFSNRDNTELRRKVKSTLEFVHGTL
jgi:wobble nucleotide-excising tRNase